MQARPITSTLLTSSSIWWFSMAQTNDFYDVDGNLIRSEPVDPNEIQEADNVAARAYLTETDWYVVRHAETGKAIPEDVLARRAEARAAIVVRE